MLKMNQEHINAMLEMGEIRVMAEGPKMRIADIFVWNMDTNWDYVSGSHSGSDDYIQIEEDFGTDFNDGMTGDRGDRAGGNAKLFEDEARGSC